MQVYRLLKDTLFDVIFGEIFRIEGHKKHFLLWGLWEKEIPSGVAMKATKPLVTIEDNITRVPLT